jgi:hypothetical protein
MWFQPFSWLTLTKLCWPWAMGLTSLIYHQVIEDIDMPEIWENWL